MILARLPFPFLYHLETRRPQLVGELLHLLVGGHQDTAGNPFLAHAELLQQPDHAFGFLLLVHHLDERVTLVLRFAQRLGRNVLLPLPPRGGGAEKPSHGRLVTEYAVHRLKHLRAGAPGLRHRLDRQPAAVSFRDFIEEADLTAAPRVDRLFFITYYENRRFIVRDAFLDQRQQGVPLHAAGVLELVEQPVAVVGIEPEIHRLAPQPRVLAAHPRTHQAFHVIEAELAFRPQLPLHESVVGGDQAPHPARPRERGG